MVMTTRTDSDMYVHEQLESALETTCATLMAVEAVRGRTSGVSVEMGRIHAQIVETIDALRRAVAAHRASRQEAGSLLAFGFVLGADCGDAPSYQVRPRRTA